MQRAIIEWQEELQRKGMAINSTKSKVMVISRKEEDVNFFCEGEELEIVDDFLYLGTMVSNTATIDKEVSSRIAKATGIYYQICNTIVGKREVTNQVKLHIFKAVFLPTLLYGSESLVTLDRNMSRMTAIEMKYLRRVAGKTRRDRIRNDTIREQLAIPPLKATFHKRQLKWFGHVCRMQENRDPRKIMEARPTGKRPRGRPRILYNEHITRLGREKGRTLGELKLLARDREDWLRWIEAPLR